MPVPFRSLSPRQFLAEISGFDWKRRIWRVDMHHTFDPDHARWRTIGSQACVEGMCRFHVASRGFEDIAQHVSIMPNGEIWTGRDWNRTPASVGFGMNRGVFMFEAVGNFDEGRDQLHGQQLESVLTVIRGVQQRFGLPAQALLFHREVPQTDKSCPGTGISKPDILMKIRASRLPLPAFGVIEDLYRLPLEHRPGAVAA